jgi:hypothetical protein
MSKNHTAICTTDLKKYSCVYLGVTCNPMVTQNYVHIFLVFVQCSRLPWDCGNPIEESQQGIPSSSRQLQAMESRLARFFLPSDSYGVETSEKVHFRAKKKIQKV